jgi:hypothetical protein
MKTKQQLQNEVSEKLNLVDVALNRVPAVRYNQCGPAGRALWDKLADALMDYRVAVQLWKLTK